MKGSNEPENGVNDSKLHEVTHNLQERIKELNCLYGISRLVERGNTSVDEILQGVAELIPPSWQYPDVTCAGIKLKTKQFKTENYRETLWKQAETIVVNGKRFGTLEVHYLEARPESDEGPFLKEERDLLHVVAERLGRIIEHKMAESTLQSTYQREKELRERLQAEMRGRVDFTRKLIHELKTPLTALMATSQLLFDETRGTRLEKIARYAWEGADNLNKRIEELHDVTKAEMGKLELKLKQLNIGQLLLSLTEETRALSQQHGMSISLELKEPLPEVYADGERVRQVMLNLINNAFEYAKDGKRVTIKASRKSNSVMIELKDYGPGIAVEKQRALFKPEHGLPYCDNGTGGLGVGLMLCKVLVELHGGKIWLRSRVGKGSSFFFTLPVMESK